MKVIVPDLSQSTMLQDPFNPLPDVSENFQQTLARIIAFDSANSLFRFVGVDFYGSLRVTKQNPVLTLTRTKAVALTSTAIDIVNSNPSRVYLSLQNVTPYIMYIYYATSVVAGQEIKLDPGDTLIEEIYTGTVMARIPTGSGNIAVTEMGEIN